MRLTMKSAIVVVVCNLAFGLRAGAFPIAESNRMSASLWRSSSFSSTSLNMVNEFFPDDSSLPKEKAGVDQEDTVKRSPKRFAIGEELDNLRMDLRSLRDNLRWAEAMEDLNRVEDLRKAIKNGENRDPEIVYMKAHEEINKAKAMKRTTLESRSKQIEKWTKIIEEARDYLPQFSLEGLWEGNYGAHGYQLVNVTYDGDILIATKVTGDANVPRGEVTFKADLSPREEKELPPLKVSGFDSGDFTRFKGEGQVSRKGFKDHRYVDGQLIMLKGRFSFLWVPTKHHVFFNRPSPETTMKRLRDVLSKEDEVENMRAHVTRCFDMDMTTCLARQQDPSNFEPFRRIKTQKELDEAEMRFKKSLPHNNLWQLLQWKKFIDKVLDGEPLQ